jgi:hypothetical protein
MYVQWFNAGNVWTTCPTRHTISCLFGSSTLQNHVWSLLASEWWWSHLNHSCFIYRLKWPYEQKLSTLVWCGKTLGLCCNKQLIVRVLLFGFEMEILVNLAATLHTLGERLVGSIYRWKLVKFSFIQYGSTFCILQ